MFEGLIFIFLFFPVLLGILSIDSEGNKFNPMAYILELMPTLSGSLNIVSVNGTEDVTELEETSEDESEPSIIMELPNEVNEGINKVWQLLWFVGSQSYKLGLWIGISTFPFHYFVGFAIAVLAVFWYPMMFVIAFFYLLITEFDEFRHLRRKDII